MTDFQFHFLNNGYSIQSYFLDQHLKLANEMASLGLVAGFTFAGHLSYWTIYYLKGQF